MRLMRSLKAALAASVCLLPLQAIAQNAGTAPAPTGDNWFTVGGQYQNSGSAYYGRFTGQNHPGFYGLGDFHINLRDPWNSGGTRYFQADGRDLGLPDRSVIVKGGQQGTWGVTFSYDGIPYYATNDFLSVWQPNGQLVPGVAAGSLTSTAEAAGLLWNEPLNTQRDIFAATGKYEWGDWTFTGSISHDHKHGLQMNSLAIIAAPSPTTTLSDRALGYFAQMIDYDMDSYDALAEYATRRLQVQLGYNFSEFTDNDPVEQLINPFAFPSTSRVGGDPALISSYYTAMPSNSAHQVRLLVGYNLSPTTRLNANFAYGVQLQNASYEPFNGNLNADMSQYSIPRSSFDGLVQTIFGNVAITSEPLPNLDIRLAYTIDDRDNQSPRNRYAFSAVDNATVTTPASGYYNLPFSYNHQSVTAEVGYRIRPQTKVSAGYRFDDTYRTYSDASVVIENSEWAQVRSQIIPDLLGTLKYTHANRTAQNYNPSGTWSYLCNGTGDCESEPVGMVLFYLATRTRDEVKGMLDWSLNEKLDGSLMVRFANDQYPDSTYGMRSNYNLSIGPDVSYNLGHNLSLHAFYTFQQIYFDQNSVYSRSPTSLGPTGTGYIAPWNLKTTDQTHTLGITVGWQAIPEKLKLTADYNFSYGDTNYAMGDGGYLAGGAVSASNLANLVILPLPDVTAMMNSISLRAEYKFRPNVTLIGGYSYERFSYADYAWNVGTTQYVNAFFPGSLQPNFGIHTVGAALRYRF